MSNDDMKKDEKHSWKDWADHPTFKLIFLIVHVIACILALIAGFFWTKPNPYFMVEGIPVFYGVYGFFVFMFIVLVGQHFRKIVGRSETYYEERE